MPERVVEPNEVSINSVFYPIVGPVQSTIASLYPGKVVIGDTSRDSNPNASVLAITDVRGGIGLDQYEGAASADRLWWGDVQTRYKGNIILAPLVTATAASGISGNILVNTILEFANAIYADFGGTVYLYDDVADSWTSKATLPNNSTDGLVARFLNGTVYMVFATQDGYTYFDGTTWTDDTKDALYVAFWDNKLWGIDRTGQLWWALTIGTETNDAQLPLEDGAVTDLFVGRSADGEPILYAMTSVGLFAHDADNARFVATEMGLPRHPRNGKGSVRWRDSTYLPAGFGIYKYGDGTSPAVISIVGPDRDDGVPAAYKGTIKQLVGSHNELFALVDAVAETPLSTLDMYDGSAMGTHQSAVVQIDTGYSYILAWNEVGGWEVKHLSAASTQAITTGIVSNAYGKYRLWFGHNQLVKYLPLPINLVNPSQITTFTYAASGTADFPWFTADQDDVDKVAIRLHIHVTGASSTETVTVSYATNYGTSYTAFTAITADGITTYEFPNNSTKPYGTTFRALRIRAALARGSTTTSGPHVKSITLEWRKKLPAKWAHTVLLDLSNDYLSNNPQQLRAALLTATESASLVEFTFRDDDGNTLNYYGDLVANLGNEFTGHDYRGQTRVSFVER